MLELNSSPIERKNVKKTGNARINVAMRRVRVTIVAEEQQ
jgi:hypothetical protein